MECRMCGYDIDTENIQKLHPAHQCTNCKSCNKVLCPRCGYANDLAFDTEFQFITKLKSKINTLRASK